MTLSEYINVGSNFNQFSGVIYISTAFRHRFLFFTFVLNVNTFKVVLWYAIISISPHHVIQFNRRHIIMPFIEKCSLEPCTPPKGNLQHLILEISFTMMLPLKHIVEVEETWGLCMLVCTHSWAYEGKRICVEVTGSSMFLSYTLFEKNSLCCVLLQCQASWTMRYQCFFCLHFHPPHMGTGNAEVYSIHQISI